MGFVQSHRKVYIPQTFHYHRNKESGIYAKKPESHKEIMIHIILAVAVVERCAKRWQ
jgi:hypothetical protein